MKYVANTQGMPDAVSKNFRDIERAMKQLSGGTSVRSGEQQIPSPVTIPIFDKKASSVTVDPFGDIVAVTVQTALQELDTEKQPLIDTGTTLQYWRGDKTWQELNTAAVVESTNLYFTNLRAQSAITGGASSIVTSNLTASRALASDASGKVAVAATTLAELNYVSGVTSAIQTQINGKQPIDADLTAIAALTGAGFSKRTGDGAWEIDTTTYLPLSGGTVTGDILFSGTPRTLSATAGILAGSWSTGANAGSQHLFQINTGCDYRQYANLTAYSVSALYKNGSTDRVKIDPLAAGESALTIDGLPLAKSSHTNATGATIGQATASVFGHVKASSANPAMNGSVAVGTDNGLFAREGHVHPVDTSRAAVAGQVFSGAISARSVANVAQANTPTGTTYTWTLTSGNDLTLTLTSSTGNVTVTTSAPAASATSNITCVGHATLARNVSLTQAGVTWIYNGVATATTQLLDSIAATKRATFRLFWASTTLCMISRVASDGAFAYPATAGGTGFSSYAIGDLLYASSTTALSKLADVAVGNVLRSGGVGVAPAWGKVALTDHAPGTTNRVLKSVAGGFADSSITDDGTAVTSSVSILAPDLWVGNRVFKRTVTDLNTLLGVDCVTSDYQANAGVGNYAPTHRFRGHSSNAWDITIGTYHTGATLDWHLRLNNPDSHLKIGSDERSIVDIGRYEMSIYAPGTFSLPAQVRTSSFTLPTGAPIGTIYYIPHENAFGTITVTAPSGESITLLNSNSRGSSTSNYWSYRGFWVTKVSGTLWST